jgi:hypothetical protein
MSRVHNGLLLLLGLALIFCAALYWRSQRDLESAQQELKAVTTANEFLKNTLSDMTLAITAKEREIDRLERAKCDEGVAQRSNGTRPPAHDATIASNRPN